MISTLENEDFEAGKEADQNLFGSYADTYMLVSTNSSIVSFVNQYQKYFTEREFVEKVRK